MGPCSKKVKGIQCVNTQGSFYCKCPEGYKQSTKNNRECDGKFLFENYIINDNNDLLLILHNIDNMKLGIKLE